MSEDSVRLVLPDPQYALFNTSREDLPAVVVVNDALVDFEATEIFPWHLTIWIEAQEIAEKGMPTRGESDVLLDFAENLEAALVEGTVAGGAPNVLFLARSTWNKICELNYYLHDPQVAHETLQILVNGPKMPRPWEYRMEQDPTWSSAAPFFKLVQLTKEQQ